MPRLYTSDTLSHKMLGMDLYRTPFQFLLPDRNESYRTCLGVCLSLFTLVILVVFATYRTIILVNFSDYQIMQASEENYFDVQAGFSADDGFQIAAGITAYDGSSDVIEDPEIGTIKFYIKYWMHEEYGDKFGFHELRSELCDPAKDLNDREGSNLGSPFFPLNAVSEDDLKFYAPKLKCIREPFSLFGNFNSYTAANLMVVFEKCDPKMRTCKTEEDLAEWLKNKYILTLQNEVKFQAHEFDTKKRLTSQSTTSWYSVSYELRLDYINMLLRSQLELMDAIYGVGSLFSDSGRGFVFENKPSRFMTYPQPFQNAVTFEISHNRQIFIRNVYTIMDLLSEVGGLFGALTPFCRGLVLIFQYDGVQAFVMSALFFSGNPFSSQNKERKEGKSKDAFANAMRSDSMRFIQWNCCKMLAINLKRFCSSKVFNRCCSKRNRRARMFVEPYEELRGELSITYVLQTLRVLRGVTHQHMAPNEWDNAFKKFGKTFRSQIQEPSSDSDVFDSIEGSRDRIVFEIPMINNVQPMINNALPSNQLCNTPSSSNTVTQSFDEGRNDRRDDTVNISTQRNNIFLNDTNRRLIFSTNSKSAQLERQSVPNLSPELFGPRCQDLSKGKRTTLPLSLSIKQSEGEDEYEASSNMANYEDGAATAVVPDNKEADERKAVRTLSEEQ